MTSIIEESSKAKQSGVFGFWRNKKVIYGFVVLIIIGGGYYFYPKGGSSSETQEVVKKDWTVKQGDITVSIESDGQVVAKDGVELSFSVSGDNLEVDEVFIKEGDMISKGDKIASVKTESLDFSLRSAWSSYQSSLADYNETMDGATKEQISSAQDKITNAEISLEQSRISLENIKQNTEDSIYTAQQKVDDAKERLDDNSNINESEDVRDSYESLVDMIKAINISLDSMLTDSDEILGVDQKSLNDDYENNLGAKDTVSLGKAKTSYLTSKSASIELNSLVLPVNIRSDYNEIDNAADQTVLALEEFEKHLYDMKIMLNASVTSVDFSQNQLESLISLITSNRTNINTKITSINSKIRSVDDIKDNLNDYSSDYNDTLRDLTNTKADGERDIRNAETSLVSREISLDQAKRDYDDLVAPLTEAELASARSRLTSSSISLEKAQYELDKSILTSPIDGQVVQMNYGAGDIIITADKKAVATIINNNTLFIEVNIEEADISTLEVGQKTYANFDALNDLRLEGEISFISLTSETSNNGIVTYLVRVLFSKGENQIREGMTATIEFVTSETKDVLLVPVSSVRNVGGKPSVQMESEEWQAVVTGFTDGDKVEVISGLNSGDKIIY
ncbi:MAG: efflux RND transporter periplasmic adaptor subunit [Patescibacteria group bacterium]|jgi:RND family efflux transporter MFP subunit|nr:efflux RND transporter periplasmic adaptor subunit [Patescibacteria group bacterium]